MERRPSGGLPTRPWRPWSPRGRLLGGPAPGASRGGTFPHPDPKRGVAAILERANHWNAPGMAPWGLPSVRSGPGRITEDPPMPTIPNQGPSPTAPRTDADVVTTDDVPSGGARTTDTPTAKDATVPADRTPDAPESAKDAPGTERIVKGTRASDRP